VDRLSRVIDGTADDGCHDDRVLEDLALAIRGDIEPRSEMFWQSPARDKNIALRDDMPTLMDLLCAHLRGASRTPSSERAVLDRSPEETWRTPSLPSAVWTPDQHMQDALLVRAVGAALTSNDGAFVVHSRMCRIGSHPWPKQRAVLYAATREGPLPDVECSRLCVNESWGATDRTDNLNQRLPIALMYLGPIDLRMRRMGVVSHHTDWSISC